MREPFHKRTRYLRTLLPTTMLVLSSACATLGEIPTERVGSATISAANGIPIGTAQLTGSGNAIALTVAVTGLTPGPHGFHLHTTGACKRPDFTSAGGHLNPHAKAHGSLSEGGSHLGDLPNLVADTDGSAALTVDLSGDRQDILAALFDNDGTAIVIHADADDYKTDPSGAAGSRVACGVVESTG